MSKNSLIDFSESDINISFIDAVFHQDFNIPWIHTPERNIFHRIVLVTKGSFIAYVDKKKYIIKENQLFYVPNKVSYKSESLTNQFQYVSVLFSAEKTDFPLKTIYDLEFPEKFLKLFENMEKIWVSKTFGYRLKTKIILYEILKNMLTEYLFSTNLLQSYNTIGEAVKYIEENYDKEFIDINELANMSNITPTHFIRVFKSIYSMTPKKYINKLRMDRAVELLEHSNLQISQIAFSLGFNDVYYFSKLFKQTYGKSPLNYRSRS